ncbi:CD4-2 molecule, tandem duplicate 2 [Spinachia spinachia]
MKAIVLIGFVLGALSTESKVVFINPGQKVTLECGVNAFNTLLEWYHGNDLIHHVPWKSGFPRKGRAEIVQRAKVRDTKLEINKVMEQDAGKFFCNADGKRQEQTLVVVTVRVSPPDDLRLGSEATLHCGVKGLDREPAVQWRRPDGSEHSGSLKGVTRLDAGTWECTVSHDGETRKQNLAIKIQEPAGEAAPSPSRSPKGVVATTCPDCSAVPRPPSPVLLLGLSWWVWVAVGLGCLVVVLLVVVVIALCKRIKRKKRKFQAMKNGRQQMAAKKYCQCGCPAAAAKMRQGRRREKQPAPPLQPLLML